MDMYSVERVLILGVRTRIFFIMTYTQNKECLFGKIADGVMMNQYE